MLLGRIYLIGMPGSGKSYFARLLSEHFNYPMLDLDHAVEEKAGERIPELFADRGEEYFRKLEAETLREITENHDDLIISTGGGTPCFHEGMEYMNTHGVTVFLKTDRALLVERLSEKTDRPLMQGDVEKKIDELLETRLPFYDKARITIQHRDPDLLANEISSLIKN